MDRTACMQRAIDLARTHAPIGKRSGNESPVAPRDREAGGRP